MDNYCNLVFLATLQFYPTVMIIGFTERRRTVSESMVPSGADTFSLLIGVATLRTAEREHPVNFRLQEASSSAIVEPIGAAVNPFYDATFVRSNNIDEPIEELFFLGALGDTIPPLTTFLRNDFRIEEVECFTIRLFPFDFPELFLCNEDGVGATNYFCETEICIEDDDGIAKWPFRYYFSYH